MIDPCPIGGPREMPPSSRARARRTVLTAFAILLAGCATAVPPLPPLAEMAVGSPSEYQWSPFRWAPGTTVTYESDSFVEVTRDGTSKRGNSTMTLVLAAIARTGAGHTTVEVAVDRTKLAEMRFAENGMVVDASFTTNEPHAAQWSRTLVKWLTHPMVANLASRRFAINGRHEGSFAAEDFSVPGFTVKIGSSVPVEWTFTGYRRVDGREVAEMRSRYTVHSITGRAASMASDVTLRGTGEGVQYFASDGLMVATHESMTMTVESPKGPILMRSVNLTRLVGVTGR